MKKYLLLFVWIVSIYPFLPCNEKNGNIYQSVLWERGIGEYNNYHIPTLIVIQEGILLAFCEGREAGDTGRYNFLNV